MNLTLQHIHIRSKNKFALAGWYCKNLGFKIIEDLVERGEVNGPLLITSDGGKTGISIFNSDAPAGNVFPGFGVDVHGFLKVLENFGRPVVYDHFYFFSFYGLDCDENKIEICCIDYNAMKEELDRRGISTVLMTPDTYPDWAKYASRR